MLPDDEPEDISDRDLAVVFRQTADAGNLPVFVATEDDWVCLMFTVEEESSLRTPHEYTRVELLLRIMHEIEKAHLAG